MISDKLDVADAGLFALIDSENEIHTPVWQLNQPLGHAGFVAAVFLVGVLDSADVSLGGRLVICGMRFRLHFNFKLLRLNLPVAFERNPVDDLRAAAEVD